MTDAIELLNDDHQRIQELFRQFDDEPAREARRSIIDSAIVELQAHMLAEEELVYPALRRLTDGAEMIDQALQDHREASDLMEELMDTYPGDSGCETRFRTLAETATRHFREEELEMLHRLRSLGGEELIQLAEKMTQRREEFLHDFHDRSVIIGAGVQGVRPEDCSPPE